MASSSIKATSSMLIHMITLLLLILLLLTPFTIGRPYNEQLIPEDILLNRIDLSPFEETQFRPDFLGGPGIFG
jgi:hypothetical protein